LPGASTTRSLSRHPPVAIEHLFHPVLEEHLAASGDEFVTQPGHRARQQVRTDVRLALDEDVVRRSAAGERLDDLAHHGVVDARGQLAVRIGAGPALSEVHVALRIQRAIPHQLRHIFPPRHDFLAALQEDGAYATLQQGQGAEEARGPGADDERHALRLLHALGRLRGRRRLAHVRRQLTGRAPGGQFHLQRIDVARAALLACVQHRADDPHRGQVRPGHPELLGRSLTEQLLRLVQPETDVVHPIRHALLFS
jgi:hypothetical protein